MPAAQLFKSLQPLVTCGVKTALGLCCLDDHRGGLVQPTPGVIQQTLEPEEIRHLAVEIVVVGHRSGVHQRDTGTASLHRVTRDRQGTERHAVEGIGEVDDRLASGDLAGQLQRGLHTVRPGRPGELHLVVQAARFEHHLLEALQERPLRDRGHVQAMRYAVTLEVFEQGLFQLGVVMPVVQRSRP